MFYNTKGKCCANTQVKKFAQSREIYDFSSTTTNSTTNNSTNARQKRDSETTNSQNVTDTDQLITGMSLVHVYFKELEVVKYSKQENYGIMDLIGKSKVTIS